MKKSIITTLILGVISIFLYGQGGIPGNNNNGTNFLGWDGTGVAGPLQIRNDFANQPIDFLTNSFRRMRIAGGGPFFGGNIGIGNNLPNGFVPQSRLHLRSTLIFLPLVV